MVALGFHFITLTKLYFQMMLNELNGLTNLIIIAIPFCFFLQLLGNKKINMPMGISLMLSA